VPSGIGANRVRYSLHGEYQGVDTMKEMNSNSDPPSGLRVFLKLVSDGMGELFSFLKFAREFGETVNSLFKAIIVALSVATTVIVGKPILMGGLTGEGRAEKSAEVSINFDYPNTVFGNQSGTITTDPTLTNKARRAEPTAQITTGSLGNQNKAGAKKATPEADVASNQEPITETIAHKVSNCLWGLYRVFVPKPEEAKPTA
jgi:hypothetical protein